MGSEVMVRLPFVSRAAAPGTEPTPAATAARSILIADDNVDAGQSLGYLLRAYGHQVVVVEDGLNAVTEALRRRPQVVILDIEMPKLNGYEVARQLRAEGLSNCVLVALTGYAQERDRIRAREAGFDHHFAKPLEVDQLLAVLGEIGKPFATPA
jgi:CheY-like chemotaxis protein